MTCCEINSGDVVIVRHKRSADARQLDGTEQILYQHVVTGEPLPGKHLIRLSPFTETVVWGDEVEWIACSLVARKIREIA